MVGIQTLKNYTSQIDGGCSNFTGLKINIDGKAHFISAPYNYVLKNGKVTIVGSNGSSASWANSEYPISKLRALDISTQAAVNPSVDDIVTGVVDVTTKKEQSFTYPTPLLSAKPPIFQAIGNSFNFSVSLLDFTATGFKIRLFDSNANPTTGRVAYIVYNK